MVTEDMNEYYMPIDYTESLVAIEGMVSVPKKAAKEERQETALTAADRYSNFSHNSISYLSVAFVILHT